MSAILSDEINAHSRQSVALIVPTLNAGSTWTTWLEAYRDQTLRPAQSLVVDSSSRDQTRALAASFDFQIIQIPKEDFNHGGTRQFAMDKLPKTAIVVFMTQDAVLASPQAIARLVAAFKDPSVGAAYGRQLPHKDSNPFGAHARLFNYPGRSYVRSMADVPRFGFKTAFLSNSFAAYRRSALEAVGGFPTTTIMNEDAYVAGKMLLLDWKIAYVSEAEVFHSHNYSLIEEFKRYFDIGAFHAREAWIRDHFGGAESEGKRFVRSEFSYLIALNKPYLVPVAAIRTLAKYLGYRSGIAERLFPSSLKRKLSMHPGFWRSAAPIPSTESDRRTVNSVTRG